MKEILRRYRFIVEVIIGLILLLILACVVFIKQNSKLVKSLTIEAGTPMVSVEQFIKDKSMEGSYITDIASLDLQYLGRKEIQIEINDKIYTSYLEIIDTIAPSASLVDQIVVKGETITADAFVTDIEDATKVTVSYKKKPNVSKTGNQEVVIVLEDSGGNQTELRANLAVLEVHPLVLEAGSGDKITTRDFIHEDNYTVSFETDLSKLDFERPNTHDVVLNVNGKSINSQIIIQDTTAPTAKVVHQETWREESIDAISFITDIIDATNVKTTYKEMPDFSLLGDQKVNILLEDESGNQTELTSTLTVKEDTEPPVIIGVRDKTCYIGEALSYRKGISVKDNKDEKVDLKIDSSSVNLKKEGSYPVIYTATDKAGNVATKEATITVKKFVVTEETLNKLTDEILGKITTESMTKREVAYAIYKWVKKHLSYTGSSDKSDWMAEAYRGIKNGTGDCFTYYAISEALLTRAGIDNMLVTRVGGKTRHYWNLINCGDGWYHFDTCPNRDKMPTFMLTDAEVEKYTEYRGNNYYNFDRSLYPATPEE